MSSLEKMKGRLQFSTGKKLQLGRPLTSVLFAAILDCISCSTFSSVKSSPFATNSARIVTLTSSAFVRATMTGIVPKSRPENFRYEALGGPFVKSIQYLRQRDKVSRLLNNTGRNIQRTR